MHIIIEDIDETYVIAEADSWSDVEDVMNGRGLGPLVSLGPTVATRTSNP